MQPIFFLVAAIVIVGALVWGIMQLPIDQTFKNVARVILIVALVIYAVYVMLALVGGALPPLR